MSLPLLIVARFINGTDMHKCGNIMLYLIVSILLTNLLSECPCPCLFVGHHALASLTRKEHSDLSHPPERTSLAGDITMLVGLFLRASAKGSF